MIYIDDYEDDGVQETECACNGCIETELYSRLYCEECHDLACSESDEDMH